MFFIRRSFYYSKSYANIRRIYYHNPSENWGASKNSKVNSILYFSSTAIALIGMVYASVPLYRTFCQKTGFAGTPQHVEQVDTQLIRPVKGAKPVKITFVSDISKSLPWKFIPEQKSVNVSPGQTALAFYSATNNGDKDFIGMATYTIIPATAAEYFNKVQCFCFEQQRLEPGEQVDMPVYFYLDPEFAYDPKMSKVTEIVLGYTFFPSQA